MNHVHPRPRRRVEKRPMRPMPPPMIREPPREDLVEKAYSMGERMIFNSAGNRSRIHRPFRGFFVTTRIPQEYQYFLRRIFRSGTEFLDRMMAEQLSHHRNSRLKTRLI